MAFNVSYVFTARDRYSAIAKKVAAANEKVRRSATSASRAISSKLSPALTSIKAKANATKIQISALARSIKTKFEPAMRSVRNIGLGMTVAVTLPFILAARSATKAASDAEETRSKFATIFRDISVESESMADNFAKNFGLAGTTARRLLGDTADILTGFGFTQEGALELSNQVNELAVDLASFTNFAGGAEGASAALTKALLGERESLKSLGIAITEDLVKKKITTLISQGARFASLAEAKAQATLAIAIDQSKNAQGDYARTQNAAANVSRRLSERTVELKETFGRILLPISVKINNKLIKFIDTLNTLSPTMQRVILIVGAVLAALGPLLLIVGAIGLALPAIAVGFGAIGTAIAFMTGPIGLVLILIASIVLFMKTSEKARQVVGGAMFAIVSIFQSMGKTVGDVLFKIVTIAESTGELIGAALGKIGEFISPVVTFIDGLIASVIDRVKSALNFLGGVFDKFKGFAASIGLIDLPDQDVAINLIPPEAIVPQEVGLKLVPLEAIAPQDIALNLMPLESIAPQEVALKLIPPEAISTQEVALKLVPPEAIKTLDVSLNLIPPEVIAPQDVALNLISPGAIPSQEVALKFIPPESIATQEVALKLVSPDNIPGLNGDAQSVNNLAVASPAIATANANATVNGQIKVSASPGSQIDSVEQETPFGGPAGNIGIGEAGR